MKTKQQPFPELLALKANFNDWRTNKQKPGNQIPLSLRDAVLQLLHQTPDHRSLILNALGLTRHQLKLWHRSKKTTSDVLCSTSTLSAPSPQIKTRKKVKKALTFVESTGLLPSALSHSETAQIHFQLTLLNGMLLQIDCHDSMVGATMLKHLMTYTCCK